MTECHFMLVVCKVINSAANGEPLVSVHRIYQGVLYFRNVIWF